MTDSTTRLEQQNRRLKMALALVVAVTTTAALMAQLPPAERIEAQELVLVGESGEVRATLRTTPSPALSFYDEEGELTMVLGMGPDGPVLGAVQPDGTARNYLSPDAEVNPLR